MMHITQRMCVLGAKFSGKKVKDREARSIKLELAGILLDENELNSVLGEPHAHRSIYNTNGKDIVPYLKCLKALELSHAWEGAAVTLWYELGKKSLELTKAKLTKIRLEPLNGGETQMSCTVESEPTLDAKIVALIERMGSGIECEIRADHPSEQADLPLNTHGTGERPLDGTSPESRELSRTGHSIAAHAKPQARKGREPH
jgi:hypothetical protein